MCLLVIVGIQFDDLLMLSIGFGCWWVRMMRIIVAMRLLVLMLVTNDHEVSVGYCVAMSLLRMYFMMSSSIMS